MRNLDKSSALRSVNILVNWLRGLDFNQRPLLRAYGFCRWSFIARACWPAASWSLTSMT